MKSWTFVSPTSSKRCVSIRVERTLIRLATRSQQTHGMTSLPSRHAPSSQPTPRGERIVQPHIRVPPQPRVLAPPPRVHQPNQPTLSLPTSNAWIHHHHRCSRHQRSSAENPQISRTSRYACEPAFVLHGSEVPFPRMVGRMVLHHTCSRRRTFFSDGRPNELSYTGPRYLFLGWSVELSYIRTHARTH